MSSPSNRQPLLPLLRAFLADDRLACGARHSISAAQFCRAAVSLASRLPRATFAFNLCERQIEFLLATAAALVNGQTLVLPHSRLPAAIASLRQRYSDSYSLVDAPPAPAVRPGHNDVLVRLEQDLATHWPPPEVPAAHTAAILFTSGSTGEPQPQAKTWRELVEGSDTFMRSLGSPPPGTAILGTIAPQHMFGFESTVMLPLQSGTPILATRPVYPADLTDALAAASASASAGVWLMTTPLQLRAFHRAFAEIRGVHRITASTMPLDYELAFAVERDWHVPVHEIYGCTEGGILATRRPAHESHFTPAAFARVAVDAHGSAQFAGAHLAATLSLADRIRLVDGGFELLGRDHDVVKIAGKRASLQALTHELLMISGVHDAVVFLPRIDSARVAAAVVAPGRTLSDIRRELAHRIDSAFMPRPMVLCDALPRSESGKLPRAALCAAIEAANDPQPRVLTQNCKVECDHPALSGHFPGEPIVPGVVLLQMIESLLAQSGYSVHECTDVKFRSPVAPAQAIDLRVVINGDRIARFAATTRDGIAMSGTFTCARAAAS